MKKRILLVHYNPRDLNRMAAWAASLGHEAICARSGDEAVTALSGQDVDCILIDPLLPGVSGFQLAEDLSRLAPDTPILVATALYRHMLHQGRLPGNVSVVHLEAPMDEDAFAALVGPGSTASPPPSEGDERSATPPAGAEVDLRHLLELDPDLEGMLH